MQRLASSLGYCTPTHRWVNLPFSAPGISLWVAAVCHVGQGMKPLEQKSDCSPARLQLAPEFLSESNPWIRPLMGKKCNLEAAGLQKERKHMFPSIVYLFWSVIIYLGLAWLKATNQALVAVPRSNLWIKCWQRSSTEAVNTKNWSQSIFDIDSLHRYEHFRNSTFRELKKKQACLQCECSEFQ